MSLSSLSDPSNRSFFSALSKPMVGSGIACNVCKAIFPMLHHDLQDEQINKRAKEVLTGICSKFYKAETCKQWATTLVDNLTEEETPSLGCASLCGKTASMKNFAAALKLAENNSCEVCKKLYPALHRYLQNEKVRDQIKTTVARICNHTRNPEQCKRRINGLIDNLAEEETAAGACSSLCEQ